MPQKGIGNMYQIAIDGPSGAGKSSLARRVARELSYIYVDTGAMYRAVGLYMYQNGIEPTDAEAVTAALENVQVTVGYENGEQHVYLGGKDVSAAIREHIISRYASCVSAIPAVRAFLLELQRDMAKTHNVVMDGRDIGTVIFPNAQVKLYLTADDETRARRRCEELKQKGQSVDYETVLHDIRARDAQDAGREIAPAKPAEDAVFLDNSHITEEETVQEALAIIRRVIG